MMCDNPVQKVQTALDELHYTLPERFHEMAQERADLRCEGSIIHSDATIFTVDDASKAIGVKPEEILKSLIFMVDGSPLLVLMSGPNKVHSGKVKRLSKGHKVTMAPPDWVFENFGFRIGGVPPLGYPTQLPALVDDDLWKYEYVWAAAGTDHAFFPIEPERLLQFVAGQRAVVKKEETSAPSAGSAQRNG